LENGEIERSRLENCAANQYFSFRKTTEMTSSYLRLEPLTLRVNLTKADDESSNNPSIGKVKYTSGEKLSFEPTANNDGDKGKYSATFTTFDFSPTYTYHSLTVSHYFCLSRFCSDCRKRSHSQGASFDFKSSISPKRFSLYMYI
jgi:hypothetical protein